VTRWILENDQWVADATRDANARATDEDIIQRDPLRRLTPCRGTLEPRGAMTHQQYAGAMRAARAGRSVPNVHFSGTYLKSSQGSVRRPCAG